MTMGWPAEPAIDMRVALPADAAPVASMPGEPDLRMLLELSGSGFAQADVSTGRLLSVNRKFCEMLGYTEAELLSTSFWDLLHPDDWEENQASCHALLSGAADQWQAEKRYLRKDGSVLWALLSGGVLRDAGGRPVRSVAVLQDITERKGTEQALREREESLTIAMEVARLGRWEVDLATGCIEASPLAKAHFGLAPDAAFTAEIVHAAQHPDDRDRARRAVEAAIAGGPEYDVEYRNFWPNGSLHWIRARGRIVRDAAGKPVRMLGVCMDVTESKLAEQRLREADRRKDEFLAMLAHELRNPLAPISTGVELLRLGGQAGDERWQATLPVLERQMRHLTRLVDDLLDVSRITRGKVRLQRQRVELAPLVQQAVEEVRPLIDARRHRLVTISGTHRPIWLEADPTRLTQVLGNLLANAAKYTEPGGLIQLTLECEDGQAVLRVRDSGIGLAPEMLEGIFELFTQAERSLDRSQGGLGVGLTLARALVEMHGGAIEASSEGPGHGCEFVVRLPCLAEHRAPEQGSAAPSAPLATRSLRILVIDDNVDAAESLALLLRVRGHEVWTLYDGLSAAEAAAQHRPHVVLLDIGLPHMDGYAVARQLRSASAAEDVCPLLIALSGYGQPEDRRRSAEAGFDQHLVKPVDFAALGRLLEGAAQQGIAAAR